MDFNLAFPAQLSLHLRSMRKARGLSQVQLAARMGVTQSRIAALEKDASKLTTEHLFRVLAALNAGVVLRMEDVEAPSAGDPSRTEPVANPPTGGRW